MSNPPRTRISQMNEEQFEQRVRDLEAEVNRRIAQKGENERPSSRPVTQRTTYLTRTERRESQVSRTCAVPTQPAQPSNNSRSRLPVEGSRTSSQKQCSHCEKCRGRNYEPESSWGISFNNGQMHVGGLRGWEGFNKRMKALKQGTGAGTTTWIFNNRSNCSRCDSGSAREDCSECKRGNGGPNRGNRRNEGFAAAERAFAEARKQFAQARARAAEARAARPRGQGQRQVIVIGNSGEQRGERERLSARPMILRNDREPESNRRATERDATSERRAAR